MATYGLMSPCAQCPFRTDIQPYLTPGRARDILTANGEFHCHKTVADRGDEADLSHAQVCAGFLICLEHNQTPNQMMRIAERIGFYDRSKLKMDAPVYGSVSAAIRAHAKAWRRRKAKAVAAAPRSGSGPCEQEQEA